MNRRQAISAAIAGAVGGPVVAKAAPTGLTIKKVQTATEVLQTGEINTFMGFEFIGPSAVDAAILTGYAEHMAKRINEEKIKKVLQAAQGSD